MAPLQDDFNIVLVAFNNCCGMVAIFVTFSFYFSEMSGSPSSPKRVSMSYT